MIISRRRKNKNSNQGRKTKFNVYTFGFFVLFLFLFWRIKSFFDKVFGLHLLDVEFKLLFCFSSLCRRVLIGMCANQIRLFVIWKKGERKKRIKALKKEELNLGGFKFTHQTKIVDCEICKFEFGVFILLRSRQTFSKPVYLSRIILFHWFRIPIEIRFQVYKSIHSESRVLLAQNVNRVCAAVLSTTDPFCVSLSRIELNDKSQSNDFFRINILFAHREVHLSELNPYLFAFLHYLNSECNANRQIQVEWKSFREV